jgi:hypothetical protein
LEGGDSSRTTRNRTADNDKDNEGIQFKEGKVKKLAISAFLAVVLTGILVVPAMAAAPRLHKVTGGGGVLMGADGDEAFRNLGFTAQQIDESGGAKGEFVCWARNIDPELRLKADILYLAVDGNTAWLGGVITQSNADWLPVGGGMCVKVVDNGQGSKATGPDRISYIMIFVDPADALLMPDIPLLDFVRGNIQVS